MQRKKVKDFPTIRIVGLSLVIIGAAMTVFYELSSGEKIAVVFLEFAQNVLGVELFGMGLTVFFIDWLYERRDERQKKNQLIRELGSADWTLANRAVLELSSKGWLSDGTLKGSILLNANLENADLDDADFSFCMLEGANFRGAHLGGANFQGANLKKIDFSESFLEEVKCNSATIWNANFASANMRNGKFENASLWQSSLQNSYLQDCSFSSADLKGVNFSEANRLSVEQFMDVSELRGAIMADGFLYDGRYQLKGDLAKAQERGINIHDEVKMAEFYGVSLETYRSGLGPNNS